MRTFAHFVKHQDVITEAFSEQDLMPALSKIQSVLERELGQTLYQHAGVDQYSNSNGIGFGIRFYVGDSDQAIRFNFAKSGGSNNIESVDIWQEGSSNKFPEARILTSGTSIVRIIPQIVQVMANPSSFIGQTLSDISVNHNPPEEDVVSEARRGGRNDSRITSLYNQGHSVSKISNIIDIPEGTVRAAIKRMNLSDRSIGGEVVAGEGEYSSDPDLANAQAALDEQQYADPETIFEDMTDLLDLVIQGLQPSLLITGMAGIGKTHIVLERLKDYVGQRGEDWHIFKGTSTAAGMYRLLFENRHSMTVFDDCDDVLKDATARNILKAALDSYDKRELSWISAKTFDPEGMSDQEVEEKYEESGQPPRNFEYTGQVIFISNMDKSKIEPAILSRSFVIDITLKASDVFLRIESILDHILPTEEQSQQARGPVAPLREPQKITHELKQEVLDFLKDEYEREGGGSGKEANLRTFINSCKVRAGGSPNWERLVARYA